MQIKTGFTSVTEYKKFDAEVGGLVGLLVGDALGVAFEFHPPERLPPRNQIEMQPPAKFPRSHVGVPPGTWSDDGAQALCLLASLLERDRLSLVDFSQKLLQWLDDGYMAVDGDVFDVGIQTSRALEKLRDGMSSHESGGASEMDNGNGSLMRVLPLALWHTGSEEALVADAHLQSLPTHAHARSMVACGYLCLVGRAYLNKLDDPWGWADHRLEAVYSNWRDPKEGKVFLSELEVLRNFPKTDTSRGTGYVLDTIWSARQAMEEKSFEDVVRTAILFGNDTDTTGAVSASLAGIRFGISGIPQRWLEQLRGFELVEPLLRNFEAKIKNSGVMPPSLS